MKVTESRFKNRQLHIEDYLQMVSAEQKEYAEVFDYSKITEKAVSSQTIGRTIFWN